MTHPSDATKSISSVTSKSWISKPVELEKNSLWRASEEHDACGVGFVAQIQGQRSHRVLEMGLASLCNLAHRGAIDADAKTGDGAGVLTQLPHKIFRKHVEALGHQLFKNEDLGVGVVFLPHDNKYQTARAQAICEDVIKSRGLFLFGWRAIPTHTKVLGNKASSTLPVMMHLMVGRQEKISDLEFERQLFLARNEIEFRVHEDGIKEFYFCSFSHRTIVYKGLLVSPSLEKFYSDLSDPDYETAICLFHQRYSTNTFPTWSLAQPFRTLAHNGEINTLKGNCNWMRAREAELDAACWGEDIKYLSPIIQPYGSDSSSLDNALEMLTMSGRDPLHAMTMLVPPAWRNDHQLTPEIRAFYEYHRCFIEPWDGPAAFVFTDGETVAACLDRNGLRPARFKLTQDGIFAMGSEVGMTELDDRKVIEKGRLAPGEMIGIKTKAGRLLRDAEIKQELAERQPYGEWLKHNLWRLNEHRELVAPPQDNHFDILGVSQQQVAFGYTNEELNLILKPMAEKGEEPVGSMGDDTPLAVLSLQPRLLYTYFKQLFAQVTNPPIDPIREKLVMSLVTALGWRRNLLGESPEHARLIQLESPVLFDQELTALKKLEQPEFAAETLSVLWDITEGPQGMRRALDRLCENTTTAIRNGKHLIILSDRGVDHAHAAIPMLLATGAVHHHLVNQGLRMKASIICESGEARDTHQLACLIGYGASAINPYLAVETLRELTHKEKLGSLQFAEAATNYRQALDKGLLKIMSKMGISVLASYHGAQIFEAIGLSTELVKVAFCGTSSKVKGISWNEIAQETLARHNHAFGVAVPTPQDGDEESGALDLGDPGYYRFRREGEAHAVTPQVIKNFHTFVRTGEAESYKAYVEAIRATQPLALRDLLEFQQSKEGSIPVEEVEPIDEIRRRFTTAGMSLGALSPEAHECLAIAMNRIGGKSNSGEGGEDERRFHRLPNGDLANSAIKQVASGRFGVHAAYLASAKEIEIKMAQGAKPGEGGQLPGHKVDAYIAQLRHSMPGVTLISPPPHHDIYSIEDLAQLIFDLKMVNPRARVCVKLVAEAGVGTVAAGVAKAHADIILISGHDGGTGASPLSSIKHAGSPWEIGLAEAHQVLMMNGLRDRVTLRTDGGLKTGADIVQATLLGAEEYNFGTIALIAAGCVYVRQCHLNTCPVGVATQVEKLRAKFKGKPEHIIAFFDAVAEEVRELMAWLGVPTIDDLVGRVDLLRQRHVPDHPKANTLKLDTLLSPLSLGDEGQSRHCTRERNDPPNDRELDDIILQDAKDAINGDESITLSYKVRNTDRDVATKVSGEIGYQHRRAGLPEGTINLNLTGSAGQSLGCFLTSGIKLDLVGEANDYVGKGMSGGEIIVRPPTLRQFVPHENMIIGNTVLYGATGGALFASGRAGERFCVRNSGANAVVEGVGDHGCEYMTNGMAIVLGATGRNFGAGMTGGIAFVYDEHASFPELMNNHLIQAARLEDPEDVNLLKEWIYRHLDRTESERARQLLGNWSEVERLFWKVTPKPGAGTTVPAAVEKEDLPNPAVTEAK
ncbi:MAG: glutamate synthase large subunit [Verrucomicrobiales bacterium]